MLFTSVHTWCARSPASNAQEVSLTYVVKDAVSARSADLAKSPQLTLSSSTAEGQGPDLQVFLIQLTLEFCCRMLWLREMNCSGEIILHVCQESLPEELTC